MANTSPNEIPGDGNNNIPISTLKLFVGAPRKSDANWRHMKTMLPGLQSTIQRNLTENPENGGGDSTSAGRDKDEYNYHPDSEDLACAGKCDHATELKAGGTSPSHDDAESPGMETPKTTPQGTRIRNLSAARAQDLHEALTTELRGLPSSSATSPALRSSAPFTSHARENEDEVTLRGGGTTEEPDDGKRMSGYYENDKPLTMKLRPGGHSRVEKHLAGPGEAMLDRLFREIDSERGPAGSSLEEDGEQEFGEVDGFEDEEEETGPDDNDGRGEDQDDGPDGGDGEGRDEDEGGSGSYDQGDEDGEERLAQDGSGSGSDHNSEDGQDNEDGQENDPQDGEEDQDEEDQEVIKNPDDTGDGGNIIDNTGTGDSSSNQVPIQEQVLPTLEEDSQVLEPTASSRSSSGHLPPVPTNSLASGVHTPSSDASNGHSPSQANSSPSAPTDHTGNLLDTDSVLVNLDSSPPPTLSTPVIPSETSTATLNQPAPAPIPPSNTSLFSPAFGGLLNLIPGLGHPSSSSPISVPLPSSSSTTPSSTAPANTTGSSSDTLVHPSSDFASSLLPSTADQIQSTPSTSNSTQFPDVVTGFPSALVVNDWTYANHPAAVAWLQKQSTSAESVQLSRTPNGLDTASAESSSSSETINTPSTDSDEHPESTPSGNADLLTPTSDDDQESSSSGNAQSSSQSASAGNDDASTASADDEQDSSNSGNDQDAPSATGTSHIPSQTVGAQDATLSSSANTPVVSTQGTKQAGILALVPTAPAIIQGTQQTSHAANIPASVVTGNS